MRLAPKKQILNSFPLLPGWLKSTYCISIKRDEHCQNVPSRRDLLSALDHGGGMVDLLCGMPEQLLILKLFLKRDRCFLCIQCLFLGAVFQVTAHMHTLSQSSVPPTLFQDSSSWCDLSSFEFFEEADFSPSQHHAGRALQLQQREGSPSRPAGEASTGVNPHKLSEGSLDPLKPLPPSRHSTIPLVILRNKRGQASPLAAGGSSAFLFAGVSSSTPKRSPFKSLPFSPSQVEHDFCPAITNFQQTLET